MPPLLQRLSERKPEELDYLGVSFGLTKELLRFWKRSGFVPLYASQKENDLTGEFSFVMLRGLSSNVAQADGWLSSFSQGTSCLREPRDSLTSITDFRQRFMKLLSYDAFKKFHSATALSILDAASPRRSSSLVEPITSDELTDLLIPFDMKRLESYAENMIDYHVVLDLIPTIATLFFSKRLGPECTLSAAQQSILLALGLQRKPVEALERELGLGAAQTLALFGKILRRITRHLQDIQKAGVGSDLPLEQPEVQQNDRKPVEETAEGELAADVDEEVKRARAVQRELIDSMDMSQ